MGIKSAKGMFDVLRLLAGHDAPMAAAQMSKDLDIPLTTMLRLLTTLESEDFAEKPDGGGAYILGPAARSLGFAFLSHFPVRDLALPVMQRITLQTGQTSSLFVRLGDQAVRAATVLGEGVPSQHIGVGVRRPLGTGAAGMMLLTHAADRAEWATLAPLRDSGWAQAPCPFSLEAWDIAVPLFDRKRQVIAVLGLENVPDPALCYLSAPQGVFLRLASEVGQTLARDARDLDDYRHIPVREICFPPSKTA